MVNLILLTEKDGSKVVVNLNMVTYMYEYDGLTSINFPYAVITVKETIQQIGEIIKKGC